MRKRSRITKRRRKIGSKPGKEKSLQSREEHAILQLQRILGNRAVAEIVSESKGRPGSLRIQRRQIVQLDPDAADTKSGWASDHGGTPIPIYDLRMTVEELKEIYPRIAADAAKDPPLVTEKHIANLASYLSDAFELMRLDTVEAQANYLAHGAVESFGFKRFTEAQVKRQAYLEDPTSVSLDTGWLNKAWPELEYEAYKMGHDINPGSDTTWQSSYIGRGPVQVTGRVNYKKTLKRLEKMADEYEAYGNTDAAEKIRQAVDKISTDPRQAANPRYTFLFSAAYMKVVEGDKKVANVGKEATFTGTGPESGWVTGNKKETEAWKVRDKAAAWRRALEVLKRKAEPGAAEDTSIEEGLTQTPESD